MPATFRFVRRFATFVANASAAALPVCTMAALSLTRVLSASTAMNAFLFRTAGALALLLSAAAMPAHAQADTACPALQDHLQEALASTVHRVGLAGHASVEVDLAGRRVVAVRATGAPPAYERALRRALQNLDCPASDTGLRTLGFKVRFVDPWGRELRDGRLVVALVH